MPLIFDEYIADTRLAVWKTTESMNAVPQIDREVILKIRSQKRRRELVGMDLLTRHLGINGRISYETTGKPRLMGKQVSISHDGDMIMVALSKSPIGVDMQAPTPKLELIKNKFCNLQELEDVSQHMNSLTLLTLIWATKEAVFKIYGSGLSFAQDMAVKHLDSIDGSMRRGNLECSVQRGHTHELRYFTLEGRYVVYTSE